MKCIFDFLWVIFYLVKSHDKNIYLQILIIGVFVYFFGIRSCSRAEITITSI